MGSAVDTAEPRERRGLSRRDMIKGAAVAGAAAWTAPVIIDSLISPAAAFSGACTKYVVKLQTDGSIYPACFGGTTTICFPASDAKWVGTAPGTTSSSCGASNPSFCPSGNGSSSAGHTPAVSDAGTIGGRSYWKVQWSGGTCGFSAATDWQLGGRYGPGSPGSQFIKTATSCSGGPSGGSNGCYDIATNTGWIPKYFSGSSGDAINYIYLKFCCTS